VRQTLVHRLCKLEVTEPSRSWEHTRGLTSLLTYAKTVLPREPFDLEEIQDSGLGRLLRQLRLRQQDD
jgi:hypothetical protein